MGEQFLIEDYALMFTNNTWITDVDFFLQDFSFKTHLILNLYLILS